MIDISYINDIKPHQGYVVQMDIDSLLSKYKSLCVARRIDGNKKDMTTEYDGKTILSDNAIVNAADLSVNLLGGKFKSEKHLPIYTKNEELNKNWKGEKISTIESSSISLKSPSFAAYYLVQDFMNFPLHQEKTFQAEKDFENYVAKVDNKERLKKEGLTIYTKNKKYKMQVTKKVNHKPTIINYWHVVFDIYPFEDPTTPISFTDRKGSHKRIIKLFKHFYLFQHVIFVNPMDYTIDSSFYKEKT